MISLHQRNTINLHLAKLLGHAGAGIRNHQVWIPSPDHPRAVAFDPTTNKAQTWDLMTHTMEHPELLENGRDTDLILALMQAKDWQAMVAVGLADATGCPVPADPEPERFEIKACDQGYCRDQTGCRAKGSCAHIGEARPHCGGSHRRCPTPETCRIQGCHAGKHDGGARP